MFSLLRSLTDAFQEVAKRIFKSEDPFSVKINNGLNLLGFVNDMINSIFDNKKAELP